MYKEINVERLEAAMRDLTDTLRKKLVKSRIISIEQWNEDFAPKLSEVAMSIEDTNVTARTYKLREDYLEE